MTDNRFPDIVNEGLHRVVLHENFQKHTPDRVNRQESLRFIESLLFIKAHFAIAETLFDFNDEVFNRELFESLMGFSFADRCR